MVASKEVVRGRPRWHTCILNLCAFLIVTGSISPQNKAAQHETRRSVVLLAHRVADQSRNDPKVWKAIRIDVGDDEGTYAFSRVEGYSPFFVMCMEYRGRLSFDNLIAYGGVKVIQWEGDLDFPVHKVKHEEFKKFIRSFEEWRSGLEGELAVFAIDTGGPALSLPRYINGEVDFPTCQGVPFFGPFWIEYKGHGGELLWTGKLNILGESESLVSFQGLGFLPPNDLIGKEEGFIKGDLFKGKKPTGLKVFNYIFRPQERESVEWAVGDHRERDTSQQDKLKMDLFPSFEGERYFWPNNLFKLYCGSKGAFVIKKKDGDIATEKSQIYKKVKVSLRIGNDFLRRMPQIKRRLGVQYVTEVLPFSKVFLASTNFISRPLEMKQNNLIFEMLLWSHCSAFLGIKYEPDNPEMFPIIPIRRVSSEELGRPEKQVSISIEDGIETPSLSFSLPIKEFDYGKKNNNFRYFGFFPSSDDGIDPEVIEGLAYPHLIGMRWPFSKFKISIPKRLEKIDFIFFDRGLVYSGEIQNNSESVQKFNPKGGFRNVTLKFEMSKENEKRRNWFVVFRFLLPRVFRPGVNPDVFSRQLPQFIFRMPKTKEIPIFLYPRQTVFIAIGNLEEGAIYDYRIDYIQQESELVLEVK